MARAFLFCPENDIALVRGTASFTPPHRAALLARYGAAIMWWLGGPDDVVLMPSGLSAAESDALRRWEDEVISKFGHGPRLVDSLADIGVDRLCPWGWSAYTAARLGHAGAPAELLERVAPHLESVRRLSHRRISVRVTRRLLEVVDFGAVPQPSVPVELFSTDGLPSMLAGNVGLYAKSPWSSSGRGVVCNRDVGCDAFIRRCEESIRMQGSVVLERAYDGVADFAMLFDAGDDGVVRPLGFSRFFTSRRTAYSGNVIAPDEVILAELCRYVPQRLLLDIRGALADILTDELAGMYHGPMGVDMMIARTPAGFMVVPCVELNLRYIMGVVAHALVHKVGRSYTSMCVAPATADVENAAGMLNLVPVNDYFKISLLP